MRTRHTDPCTRCDGTGIYKWGTVHNGVPSFQGTCYRCGGDGIEPLREQSALTSFRPLPVGFLRPEDLDAAARQLDGTIPAHEYGQLQWEDHYEPDYEALYEAEQDRWASERDAREANLPRF